MNYGLMISCRLEELLQAHHRHDHWTQADEAKLYDQTFKLVMEERPEAWAQGNIRVGDYILLSESSSLPYSYISDAMFP